MSVRNNLRLHLFQLKILNFVKRYQLFSFTLFFSLSLHILILYSFQLSHQKIKDNIVNVDVSTFQKKRQTLLSFSKYVLKNNLRNSNKTDQNQRFNSDTVKTLNDDIQNHTKYPSAAVKMGWEGVVVVEAIIDPLGYARSVKIIKSSNYNVLDNSSLEMVLSWKYKKGKKEEKIQLNFIFEMY